MNKSKLAELESFTGTENYFRMPLFRGFFYTDGIKFLMENASAYWLLDIIASAQNQPNVKNDQSLQEMQFWTLKKDEGGSATLVCERDSEDVAFTIVIKCTDFPFDVLEECKIWVAPTSLDGTTMVKVAYLPSEH